MGMTSADSAPPNVACCCRARCRSVLCTASCGMRAQQKLGVRPHNIIKESAMRLPTFLSIVATLCLPLLTRAQDAVPVYREARHKLVLDSLRFRILDVQIPARDTTGYHIHDTAILYISLLTSPTSAQVLGSEWPATPPSPPFATVGEVRIDSTYLRQPVTHRVTNAGDGTFRLLAIVSSGPARGSREEQGTLPGAIQLRSTWFRQSRIQLPARATTEWSESESPVLVVQPFASRLAVESASDTRHTLDTPGSWFLVPARVRYRITNAGSDTARAVAIQIR